MGREIVYCYKCSRRLTGDDFGKGAAFHWSQRVVCADCAPPGCAEEAAAPERKATTARIPLAPPDLPATRRSRSALWISAAASAAVALTGLLAYVTLRPAPPKAPPPVAAAPAPEAPAAAVDRTPAAAPGDVTLSMEDLSDRIVHLTGVALSEEDAEAANQAQQEADVLRPRLQAAVERELAETDRRTDAFVAEEAFGRTFDLLNVTKSRHPFPAWSFEVDRRIQGVEKKGRELLDQLCGEAREARLGGDEDHFSALRKRVDGWQWPAFLAEFDRRAPAPAPAAPPPISLEGRSYLGQWDMAWVQAGWADYAGAERRLQDAAAVLREPEWISEARQDLEDLGRMAALDRRVNGLLASCARGERLGLVGAPKSSRPGPLDDPVYRMRPEGVEFKKTGEPRPYFIAFEETTFASRLKAARRKAGGAEAFDARAAALLCLASGDAREAALLAKGLQPALPGRCVDFGGSPLPLSEGNSSALARHERAAGRLFYEVDWNYRFLATQSAAILKYRQLRDDFASTAIVKKNREFILGRCEAARELVFRADELRPSGAFHLDSWRTRTRSLESILISRTDVSGIDIRNNYVELEFSALPDTAYRCWIYAGGCCLESFTSYFQTTGYTTVDPETEETFSLEPGGGSALPLKPGIYLRATHASHARRGAEKKPSRWTWIEVPLADTGAGGLRKVRIISDQKGFAVAYAVVSRDREKPPSAAETRAYDDPEPGKTPEGSRNPGSWLLLGPFQNTGFASIEAPEEDLDLSEPVRTSDGLKPWTMELAQLAPVGGGTAAVFDFTKFYQPTVDVVAYALIHVWSPVARDVALRMGSDDGTKVWLNDTLIHQLDRGRGMTLDEDRVETRLQAGWNRLLVKVYQGKGDWGLGLRLTDREGKELPDLRYDPFGDLPGLAKEE